VQPKLQALQSGAQSETMPIILAGPTALYFLLPPLNGLKPVVNISAGATPLVGGQ